MIIYKITNKINNKVYIGQTIQSLTKRWRQHCDPSSGCTALHNAIQKYGKENFTVEQIDVACDRDELDKKEQYWIQYYDSMSPNGYNLTSGGDRPSNVAEETRIKRRIANLGKKMSEESRAKMSLSKKGIKYTDERKKQIGERFRIWWSIPENKIKMSEISKSHMTDEKRKAISELHKGRKRSPETIEKLRLAQIGKHCSEETKTKLRNANMGKKLSPETVDKIVKKHQKKVLCVETGDIFESIKSASIAYGILVSHISCVCKGKRKTCGGYHWRYVSE